ncbi:popeye domain-containing protein 3-like isoform X2 [Stegodyphus dumicola]|uniref:popeye domain-containing protein 3-like isoform X2 n=1 Tax=Stegodyphus dumicola TaxID=202533 RepID=UPI0015A76B9D|nr:popeye domain-containing protein 3-like isoform X2 [Stegodyphus dumicola]
MDDNATLAKSNTTIFVCPEGQHEPQHVMYQLANVCFIVAYLAPSNKTGLLFMHSILILGFFLFSMWAWNVVCAPDVFSWNFFFVLLNMGQMLYVLYTMRKVKFPLELEDIYRSMFQPLQVSRLSFKKLVSPECAQMMSLHPGEAYAMQSLTKTDRLGLLVSGKVNVISGQHFLHNIQAKEFLDSPEFESSRSGVEEKFKMVTEKGSHLDIRLPSFTGSLASQEEIKKRTESVFGSKEFTGPTGYGHTRAFLSE